MSDVLKILPKMVFKLIPVALTLLLAGRLTKTFQSNTDIALSTNDTSKLYYRNPKVEIEVLNAKGDFLNRGELHRVTVNSLPDQESLFDSPTKFVYAIARNKIMIDSYFDQDRILILKISTPEYSKLVYSKALLRSSLVLLRPRPLIHGTFLDFYSEDKENIMWDGFTDDYYQITFNFHYSDHYQDSVNFKSTLFTAHIPPVPNPEQAADRYSYLIYGDWFLKKVSKSFQTISTPGSLLYRKFETLDIEVAYIPVPPYLWNR